MSATICGHGRDVLIWACKAYAASSASVIIHNRFGPEISLALAMQRNAACHQLSDPTKLAAMMAWELRRPRVGVMHCGVAAKLSYLMVIVDHNERCVHVRARLARESDVIDTGVTTMPQARAMLLRILLLPEETPIAEVLKALEVPR